MQRTLQPEILDSLPHHHPDALHNRRDLEIANRLLGSHQWLERTVPPLLRPGECALELGAGTGELGRRLARRGAAVAGLDLWPRPADWPKEFPWHQFDLKQFDQYARYPVIIGNLIFHQFSAADLADLGKKFRNAARAIVACEPQRRRVSQWLYRLLGAASGANHVSLHDAHVSIAAGFVGQELPEALGLHPNTWEIRCTPTLLGLHRMIAIRRS